MITGSSDRWLRAAPATVTRSRAASYSLRVWKSPSATRRSRSDCNPPVSLTMSTTTSIWSPGADASAARWRSGLTLGFAPTRRAARPVPAARVAAPASRRLQWRAEGLRAAQIRTPEAPGGLEHVDLGEPVGASECDGQHRGHVVESGLASGTRVRRLLPEPVIDDDPRKDGDQRGQRCQRQAPGPEASASDIGGDHRHCVGRQGGSQGGGETPHESPGAVVAHVAGQLAELAPSAGGDEAEVDALVGRCRPPPGSHQFSQSGMTWRCISVADDVRTL